MTIASLIIDVAANTAKLQTDVEQIHGKLDNVSNMAGQVGKAIAGAFTISAVANFAKEMIGLASDLSDMSARTGVGVEKLQALNYAAVGSSVSIEQLAGGMSQLSKRILGDDRSAVAALEKLGLTSKDFINLPFDQQLLEISDGMTKITSPAEQNAIAMALFGKAGAQFLPLLKDNIRALTEEAERNGAVMSKELIDKADALDDAFSRGTIQVKALAFSMSADLVSALTHGGFAMSAHMEATEKAAAANKTFADSIDQLQTTMDNTRKASTVPLMMSELELTHVTEDLNDKVKASIKVHEEHARSVEKSERAYRQYVNFVGERYIETVRLQQEETAKLTELMKESAASILEGSSNINTALDEQSEKWTEVYTIAVTNSAQEIDDALMRIRESGVEYAMTLGEAWRQFGDSMIDRTVHMVDLIGSEIGGRFGGLVRQMTGAWDNGKTLMKGIGQMMHGDFSGLVDSIMAGIGLIKSAWQALKGLFGGGEEGTMVNPARDKFIAQYGGFDAMKGLMNVAGMDADLTESLTMALLKSDTMAKFSAAQDAIIALIGGTKFHSGGLVPGTGEVRATLLGGERVQSRSEVAEMGGMLTEMRGMRADLYRVLQELPGQITAQAHIARGQGLSRG